jgi:hypothetical protein
LYLATVIDLYSRRLLGAATGLHPDADSAAAGQSPINYETAAPHPRSGIRNPPRFRGCHGPRAAGMKARQGN